MNSTEPHRSSKYSGVPSNFRRAKFVLGARFPGNLKLLLHTFISHADVNTGACWPSIETLRREMGVASKTTVRQAIKVGVALGVISEEKQSGPHGCNRFTILDANLIRAFELAQEPESVPGSNSVGGSDSVPGTDIDQGGTEFDLAGSNSDPEPTSKPINKPKHKTPPAKPSAALVDSVWAKCTWKQTAPAAAKQAIAKSIRDVASGRSLSCEQAAAFLAERAAAYAASPLVQQTEMRFRPKPTNWFRDGHFDDDPATWQLETPSSTQGPAMSGRPNSQLVKRF